MKLATVSEGDARLSRFSCECGKVHRLKRCCDDTNLRYLGEERSPIGHRVCAIVCETCKTGLIWIEDPPG